MLSGHTFRISFCLLDAFGKLADLQHWNYFWHLVRGTVAPGNHWVLSWLLFSPAMYRHGLCVSSNASVRTVWRLINNQVLKRTWFWLTFLIEMTLFRFLNDCGIFLIKCIVPCQVYVWGLRDYLSWLGITDHSYRLMLGKGNYLQERDS